MQIRKAPLVEPVKNGIKYLALALPLIACSPSDQISRPQQQASSDVTEVHPSLFGRLFSSAPHTHVSLPEAHMITRELACVPYLGNDNQAQAVIPAIEGDLWQRLRDGMQLDHSVDDARVQKEIAFYSRNQRLLNLIAKQASLYMYHVLDELERRNMPLELALIPAIESTYNPLARSPGGAIGMWQFMPGTARVYGLHVSNNFDERRDVVESTNAALDYLARLDRKLGGDWLNAVAAYNTGEMNIIAAMDRNRRRGKPTDYWHLELRQPTSHYVPRLIALSKILANPSRYGIELMPVENAPVFATISMDSRFSLTQTASAAGISTQQLFALNPGLNRNALPRGSYPLHVPFDRSDEFQRALAGSKPQPTAPMQVASNGKRYVVQRGDSLGAIAQRFGTSVDSLRSANGIKGNAIRAGQTLVIASATSNRNAIKQTAPALSATTQLTTPKVSTVAGPVKRHHTVKEGENLWRIADRFDVSVADILRWNELDKKELLQPGQRLTLHVAH